MKFYFSQTKALLGFSIGSEAVVLTECYQGKNVPAMLATFSPMFPDNARAVNPDQLPGEVTSALSPYPLTSQILLGENGGEILLNQRKCGSSKIIRTTDSRCTAVRILDPE